MLEVVLQVGQELIGGRAVDQPVIEAHRKIAAQADADHVVDHHRPLLDGADRENGHLRLVDDRQAELRAVAAGVGERDGAAVHFVGAELLRAGAIGDVLDGAGDAEQALLGGVLDHGHDEPVVE